MIKTRVFVKTKRKRLPPARLRAEYKKSFQNFQRRMGMKGVIAIKDEIKKRNLRDTDRLYNSVGYKFTPQGIRYIVDTEYAKYLEEGVKSHQMVYLTKSDKPIPLNLANRLFRWASPKSMREGSWWHPGFQRGRHFMSSSIKRMRKQMGKEAKSMAMKAFKS